MIECERLIHRRAGWLEYFLVAWQHAEHRLVHFYWATQHFLASDIPASDRWVWPLHVCLQNSRVKVCPEGTSSWEIINRVKTWEEVCFSSVEAVWEQSRKGKCSKGGKFLQCIHAHCASYYAEVKTCFLAEYRGAGVDLMNVGKSLRGESERSGTGAAQFLSFRKAAELHFLIWQHTRKDICETTSENLQLGCRKNM